jgi:aminotransferase
MSGRVAGKVRGLPPSGLRRFFDLVSKMDDVVTLGVGEPDFATPWHVCDAMVDALERGRTSYTPSAGIPTLRQAISTYVRRRYEVDYDPDCEVLVANGVSEALDLAFRALLEPGDQVAVVTPCYVAYPACVDLAGGEVIAVGTRFEDDFALDPELLEGALTPRTRVLLLCYPNNPTGAVMSREQLERIARIAVERDLIVVSDEVYDQLVYRGHEHVCVPALPGMRERTLLLNGFSKSYAMTGLRLGYACGPEDVIAGMLRIHQYTALCCSVVAQWGAVEALTSGDAEAARMRDEYARRRPYLTRALNEIGLPCFEPKGAFYCFPSIRHTGLTSEEFAGRLLEEERVAVVPGNAFGAAGEGFVRCTYATSLDQIKLAVERMAQFLKRLDARTPRAGAADG